MDGSTNLITSGPNNIAAHDINKSSSSNISIKNSCKISNNSSKVGIRVQSFGNFVARELYLEMK